MLFSDPTPALDVCWASTDSREQVVADYRERLPADSWKLRGAPSGSQVGADRGQVRLLVHDARDHATAGTECPPDATYAVSLTAINAK